ncbi:TPA: HK97 gp10 family phage protein [Neisseria bacilliformis]|uniref:HK97 gp10 family phage protein n=1 Tax=Neisseria bacilliformis TaxID=267212 RepID=UPI00204844A4|nr:HK97 gp10 family phage protein [Neisseria bacilliformis]DAR17189.1 MAG TPA: hypothetical protein [Caudoviricetes sp.]
MFDLKVDFAAAEAHMQQLAEKMAAAVRPAAFEGAILLRRKAEELAPQSERPHWFYSTASGGIEPHTFASGENAGKTGSKYRFHPGDLKRSIYIKYLKDESADGEKAAYRVSFVKYSGREKYVPYARWVEFGVATATGERGRANPFMLNAYYKTHRQIRQAVKKNMDEAVKSGS